MFLRSIRRESYQQRKCRIRISNHTLTFSKNGCLLCAYVNCYWNRCSETPISNKTKDVWLGSPAFNIFIHVSWCKLYLKNNILVNCGACDCWYWRDTLIQFVFAATYYGRFLATMGILNMYQRSHFDIFKKMLSRLVHTLIVIESALLR